jgi:hypothetical protein
MSRRLQYREEKLKSESVRLVVVILVLIGIAAFLGPSLIVRISQLVSPDSSAIIPSDASETAIVGAPQFDPQPTATNSSPLKFTGRGTQGSDIVLYRDGSEVDRTLVANDGTFLFPEVALHKGQNTFSGKSVIRDQESSLSDPVEILYQTEPPTIDVTSPTHESTVREERDIVITGKAEGADSLLVNDRIVPLTTDGSFSYAFKLSDGDNHIKLTARDDAGNETTQELTVRFEP